METCKCSKEKGVRVTQSFTVVAGFDSRVEIILPASTEELSQQSRSLIQHK